MTAQEDGFGYSPALLTVASLYETGFVLRPIVGMYRRSCKPKAILFVCSLLLKTTNVIEGVHGQRSLTQVMEGKALMILMPTPTRRVSDAM